MDTMTSSSASSHSSHSNRSTPNGNASAAKVENEQSAKAVGNEPLEIRPYELVADFIRSYVSAGSGTTGKVWVSVKFFFIRLKF